MFSNYQTNILVVIVDAQEDLIAMLVNTTMENPKQ